MDTESRTPAPLHTDPDEPATTPAVFAENLVADVEPVPAAETAEPDEPEEHRSGLRRSAIRNVGG